MTFGVRMEKICTNNFQCVSGQRRFAQTFAVTHQVCSYKSTLLVEMIGTDEF